MSYKNIFFILLKKYILDKTLISQVFGSYFRYQYFSSPSYLYPLIPGSAHRKTQKAFRPSKSFFLLSAFLISAFTLPACAPYDFKSNSNGASNITGVNIWAASDSVKVLQDLDANGAPVIVTEPGTVLPTTYTVSNEVWNAATNTITVSGARRETVAFQVFLSNPTTGSASNLNVSLTQPTGGNGNFGAPSTNGNGSTSIHRFREWYINDPVLNEYSVAAPKVTGNFPDPLIPFRDPYGTNNPVGAPFSIGPNQIQAIWVDVSIPVNQNAGTYNSSITVTINGQSVGSINLVINVWNGTLPAFDSDPTLLKAWIPIYSSRFIHGEVCFTSQTAKCPLADIVAIGEKYQIMAHQYDFDTQVDQIPVDVACNETSLDWSSYTELNQSALSGTLFGDGTHLQVINSPIPEEWNECGATWSYPSNTLPPPSLMSQLTDFSKQISTYFVKQGWQNTEILAYIWDEPGGKAGVASNIYNDVADYANAVNTANDSTGWSGSNAAPLHFFVTTGSVCHYSGTITPACEAVDSWAYPNANGSYISSTLGIVNPETWILDWAPSAEVYVPGPISGSTPGTDYTIEGIKSVMSGTPLSPPLPRQSWIYQYSDPFIGNGWLTDEALGFRMWSWAAFKYNINGIFFWAATFWGTGNSDPTNTGTATDTLYSPYFQPQSLDWYMGSKYPYLDHPSDGIIFYPGAELPLTGQYLPSSNIVLNNTPAPANPSPYSVPAIQGPVPSIRMAMWRRGYQDYMYLWLLNKTDSALAKTLANTIIQTATNVWNASPYWNIPTWGQAGAWSHVPSDYESVRLAIAKALGYTN